MGIFHCCCCFLIARKKKYPTSSRRSFHQSTFLRYKHAVRTARSLPSGHQRLPRLTCAGQPATGRAVQSCRAAWGTLAALLYVYLMRDAAYRPQRFSSHSNFTEIELSVLRNGLTVLSLQKANGGHNNAEQRRAEPPPDPRKPSVGTNTARRRSSGAHTPLPPLRAPPSPFPQPRAALPGRALARRSLLSRPGRGHRAFVLSRRRPVA